MSISQQSEIRGPLRNPRNAYKNAPNSIHNDEVAQRVGMRAGTIAGSVHMDQFPPTLVDLFGNAWFETGSLSLTFVNATKEDEAVQVIAAAPPRGADAQVDVRVEREDGLLVAEGTASVGDPGEPSHLSRIDLRATDPSELRMHSSRAVGSTIVDLTTRVDPEQARQRLADGLLTEPLEWYAEASPWGGPIASPAQIVQLLWRDTTKELTTYTGGAVGLFGSIEVRHLHGPVMVGEDYRVVSTVVAVGQSPRTEYVWFDSVASNAAGVEVAMMRMQLRWMKTSSSLY